MFGVGREKRIYAVPPYTNVVSLDFEDHSFEIQRFGKPCMLCSAENVYWDEAVLDEKGGRMFVCSDTDHCENHRTHSHKGHMLADVKEATGYKDAPPLKVRNVSKNYGNHAGCRNVYFELYPSEILAIVSESGSGETTLLTCIST